MQVLLSKPLAFLESSSDSPRLYTQATNASPRAKTLEKHSNQLARTAIDLATSLGKRTSKKRTRHLDIACGLDSMRPEPLSTMLMLKSTTRTVEIGSGVAIGGTMPLAVIAGPCVIESREHTLMLASRIAEICTQQGVPLVFKGSYDKANRSSGASYRGPGPDEGLSILHEVKPGSACPCSPDVHSSD